MDSRWPGPAPSQLSLALQQALAKDLMRAKQGQIQQGGLAFQLLQAIAALLTSAHARPIVMSMHCSHALSCPLMRQLHLYQVAFRLTAACFHFDLVSRLISGARADLSAAPRVPGRRLLLAVHQSRRRDANVAGQPGSGGRAAQVVAQMLCRSELA